jgi:hypothetical protein
MERKEPKRRQGSVKHPTDTSAVDKSESGPSRLYAPGKPHEVESGPSRLRTSVPRQQPTGAMQTTAPIPHRVDTAEAGPPRLTRHVTQQ